MGSSHGQFYTAAHGLMLPLNRFDEITERRDGVVKYSADDGKSCAPPQHHATPPSAEYSPGVISIFSVHHLASCIALKV